LPCNGRQQRPLLLMSLSAANGLASTKDKITLRPTVSRFVLVSSPFLGPKTRFLLVSNSCGFVDVGHALRREEECVIYNCCWPSPAQPFLVPSPAGLMTMFYCLRFETPPTWRARSLYFYPPRHRVARLYPQALGSLFAPPTTRSAMVEVFEPASTWGTLANQSESELHYDWRFTAHWFVLAPSPLKLTTRVYFFATEPLM
jgi:hypothetical protein